jgi:GYF domain 2
MPYYYTKENGDVVGPVSAQELNQLFNQGELGSKTQICQEGTQQWLSISSILETTSQGKSVEMIQSFLKKPAVITGLMAVALIFWKLSSIERLLDKKSTAPQFEYKIESPDDRAFTRTLDRWGKDGWELVFARRASGSDHEMSYEVILKRQVR